MASPIPNPTSARQLDVYKVALELVAAAGELLPGFARFDTSLASQLKRAAPSVPLNICEAMRRTGRDRAHLLTVAMGSAAEVQAILDVGLALGLLEQPQAQQLEQLADRVCAMLYRVRQTMA
jgi:four helix bundle protein